jgi:hypothetical protein
LFFFCVNCCSFHLPVLYREYRIRNITMPD